MLVLQPQLIHGTLANDHIHNNMRAEGSALVHKIGLFGEYAVIHN